MKKVLKSRIFAFVLGAVIFGGIVGVSAYTIFANDIGYTPKDTTWKKSNGEDITNVKDAIDELYTKASLTGEKLNYDILYSSSFKQTTFKHNYNITENDTKYRSIMVVAYSDNVSITASPSYVRITNNNITPILDPNYMEYTEYSDKKISSDIYVGVINNLIKDDIISFTGYYSGHLLILGIK